jgi:hypothetical protein
MCLQQFTFIKNFQATIIFQGLQKLQYFIPATVYFLAKGKQETTDWSNLKILNP